MHNVRAWMDGWMDGWTDVIGHEESRDGRLLAVLLAFASLDPLLLSSNLI
jgi:hypothetical protein